MSNQPDNLRAECCRFRNELEDLPAVGEAEVSESAVLACLPEASRGHAHTCAVCADHLANLVITRRALRPLAAAPEVGPWFSARVLAAIKSRENELQERREGVWVSIRRLAPRLVGFCALLLILGGTWAFQLRQSDLAKQREGESVETVFETSGPRTPFNDEVLLPLEKRRP
jgi:hypothetical protein